jgi:hypothetical protein
MSARRPVARNFSGCIHSNYPVHYCISNLTILASKIINAVTTITPIVFHIFVTIPKNLVLVFICLKSFEVDDRWKPQSSAGSGENMNSPRRPRRFAVFFQLKCRDDGAFEERTSVTPTCSRHRRPQRWSVNLRNRAVLPAGIQSLKKLTCGGDLIGSGCRPPQGISRV